MELEERNVPTITVVTDRFHQLAAGHTAILGMEGLRLVRITHPLAGLHWEQLEDPAQTVSDHMIRLLVEWGLPGGDSG